MRLLGLLVLALVLFGTMGAVVISCMRLRSAFPAQAAPSYDETYSLSPSYLLLSNWQDMMAWISTGVPDPFINSANLSIQAIYLGPEGILPLKVFVMVQGTPENASLAENNTVQVGFPGGHASFMLAPGSRQLDINASSLKELGFLVDANVTSYVEESQGIVLETSPRVSVFLLGGTLSAERSSGGVQLRGGGTGHALLEICVNSSQPVSYLTLAALDRARTSAWLNESKHPGLSGSLLREYYLSLLLMKDDQNPYLGDFAASPSPVYLAAWVRDGSFSAMALQSAGHLDSALKYWRWMASVMIANGSSAGTWYTKYNFWDGQPVLGWPTEYDGIGLYQVGLWKFYAAALASGESSNLTKMFSVGDAFYKSLWMPLSWEGSELSSYPLLPEDASVWEDDHAYNFWTEAVDDLGLFSLSALYASLKNSSGSLEANELARQLNYSIQADFTTSSGYAQYLLPSGSKLEAFSIPDSSLLLPIDLGLVSPFSGVARATVSSVVRQLTVEGGLSRFLGDTYHEGWDSSGPMPPWIITTLFLADYEELVGNYSSALSLIRWCYLHSQNGLLPEAVDPKTGYPLPSTSPLTWSAAMYVTAALGLPQASSKGYPSPVPASGGSLPASNASSSGSASLVINVLNYFDKVGVPGVRVSVLVTSSGLTQPYSGNTTYGGMIVIPLEGGSSSIAVLNRISISGNYSIVMVNSQPVLTVRLPYGQYSTSVVWMGSYSQGTATYTGSYSALLQANSSGTVQEVTLWVIPGQLVNVTSYDFFSRSTVTPIILPGLPYGHSANGLFWQFFVPIGYPLRVSAVSSSGQLLPSFTVQLVPGERSVDWSYLYSEAKLNSTIGGIQQTLEQLSRVGLFPVSQAQYSELLPISELALSEMSAGKIEAANMTFSELSSLISSVRGQISGSYVGDWIAALVLFVLLYAFSEVLIFPLSNRVRWRLRPFLALFVYVPASAILPLVQPYLMVALGSLFGLELPMPASLAVSLSLLISLMFYVLFSMIGKAFSRYSFSYRLAMSNLLSRLWRVLLVLVPLMVVVGSTMAIVGVSAQYGLVDVGSGSFQGPSFIALDLEHPRPGYQAEVLWLETSNYSSSSFLISWVPSSLVVSGIPFVAETYEAVDSSGGVVYLSGIYSVPDHAWNYVGLNSSDVIGSLPSPGSPEVLLPEGSQVQIGQSVTLAVPAFTAEGQTETLQLGKFEVVGFYKPIASMPRWLPSVNGAALISWNASDLMAPRELVLVGSADSTLQLAKKIALLTGYPVFASTSGSWRAFQFTYVLGASHAGAAAGPVIISAFLAYTYSLAFVDERRRDIRVMSALGAPPAQMAAMMLAQVGIIGLIATPMGILLSYALSKASVSFVPSSSGQVASPLSLVMGILIGMVIPLLAALVAFNSAPESRVIGGAKKRVIPSEAILEGGMAVYRLPLRVSEDESELFADFLREELLPRLKGLDPQLTVSEAGRFTLKMDARWRMEMGSPEVMFIRSEAHEGVLTLTFSFPPVLSEDRDFQAFLYNLERRLLAYPLWREKKVRVVVTRRIVSRGEQVQTREKGLEEVVEELQRAKQDVDAARGKLEQLYSMKGEISPSVFADFERRYRSAAADALKRVRSLSDRLPDLMDSVSKQRATLVKRLADLDVSAKLGEISQEQYASRREALEAELQSLSAALSILAWAQRELSAPS